MAEYERVSGTGDSHHRYKVKIDDGEGGQIDAIIDTTSLTDKERTEWVQLEESMHDGSQPAEHKSVSSMGQHPNWTEEDQAIWDSDIGAVNECAIKYDTSEYIETGKLVPDWGDDAADNVEKVVLPEGAKIVQYAHPNSTGSYFAPVGTKYDDLQLYDSSDKRIPTMYEVAAGGLSAEQSEVAIQPWNKTMDSPKGTGALQYKTAENAETLVKQGKLRMADNSD